MTIKTAYKTMFTEYPDVLNIKELCTLLNISKKTAYKLLQDNEIEHLKIGREYRIPKMSVIKHFLSK